MERNLSARVEVLSIGIVYNEGNRSCRERCLIDLIS